METIFPWNWNMKYKNILTRSVYAAFNIFSFCYRIFQRVYDMMRYMKCEGCKPFFHQEECRARKIFFYIFIQHFTSLNGWGNRMRCEHEKQKKWEKVNNLFYKMAKICRKLCETQLREFRVGENWNNLFRVSNSANDETIIELKRFPAVSLSPTADAVLLWKFPSPFASLDMHSNSSSEHFSGWKTSRY